MGAEVACGIACGVKHGLGSKNGIPQIGDPTIAFRARVELVGLGSVTFRIYFKLIYAVAWPHKSQIYFFIKYVGTGEASIV